MNYAVLLIKNGIDWAHQFQVALLTIARYRLPRKDIDDLNVVPGGQALLDKLERFINAGVLDEFYAYLSHGWFVGTRLVVWLQAVVAYWF